MKEIKFNAWNSKWTARIRMDEYVDNGNTAILVEARENDEPWHEPFSVLTVNIKPLPMRHVFIDTNNNPAELIQVMEKLELIKPLGKTMKSGFCTYPEYEINLDKLNEYNCTEEEM